MSIDKLTEAIYPPGSPGDGVATRAISPRAAANRVHDRFVVIDRSDLPKVALRETDGFITTEVDGSTSSWGDHWDAARFEREARSMLAMAEYLRANPPVDEEAVRAAARSMWPEATTSEQEYNARIEVARRLVADGWTKP